MEKNLKMMVVSWCCGCMQSPNDAIQKTESNTHTTTHKQTNNGFLDTKKTPDLTKPCYTEDVLPVS